MPRPWIQRENKRHPRVWTWMWQYVLIFTFLHLVRFLMMNFSTPGPTCVELLAPFQVNRPAATMSDELLYAPVITIGGEKLALDREELGRLDRSDAERQETHEQLVAGLESIKSEYTSLYPYKEFPTRVVINADGKVPFGVLRKVMDACRTAGYDVFDLAVYPALWPGP